SFAIRGGELEASFGANTLRTFAVTLRRSTPRVAPLQWWPVPLDYDIATASRDGTKSPGQFDLEGRTLAAEMLPDVIEYAGVEFHLAPAREDVRNAVTAHGQTIRLPTGHFDRVYLLMASGGGDQKCEFRVGVVQTQVVQDWGGFIGQWDARTWSP